MDSEPNEAPVAPEAAPPAISFFGAAGRALKAYLQHLNRYAVINFTAAIVSLLLLPMPYMASGLYGLAGVRRREAPPRLIDLWRAARPRWRSFYLAGLLNLLALLILWSNLVFYGSMEPSIRWPMLSIVGLGMLVWAGVQMLAYPMLVQQAELKLLPAYRYAFRLALFHPLLTLELVLFSLVLLVFSLFALPLLLFFTPLYLALLGHELLAQMAPELYPASPADEPDVDSTGPSERSRRALRRSQKKKDKH